MSDNGFFEMNTENNGEFQEYKPSISFDFTSIEIKRLELVESLIRNICKEEAFICGGYARVACSPCDSPIVTSDIDIYALKEEYVNVITTRLLEHKYIKVKENDVSFVYSNVFDASLHQINVIKPIQTGNLHTFGELPDILKNFDFSVARIGIYLKGDEVSAMADEDFVADELAHRLVIKNIHCPVAEIARISKYMKKGYFCPLSQIIKCFVDWEGRDEEYRHGLVEALSTKKELTASDIQELYSRLYID